MTLGSREMTVEAGQQCVKDMKEWRALLHLWMINFNAAIFHMSLHSLRLPSFALMNYHLERGGMPLYDADGINCKKGTTTENQDTGAGYMD